MAKRGKGGLWPYLDFVVVATLSFEANLEVCAKVKLIGLTFMGGVSDMALKTNFNIGLRPDLLRTHSSVTIALYVTYMLASTTLVRHAQSSYHDDGGKGKKERRRSGNCPVKRVGWIAHQRPGQVAH